MTEKCAYCSTVPRTFVHDCRFARLFCLLSSKILQNNLLDLYLVEIRRYKLSFFAKEVTKTPHASTKIFSNFERSLCEAQTTWGLETTPIFG